MLRNLNQSSARGRICGTPHSGVLAAAVNATIGGDDGDGLLVNDVLAGDPAGCEYRVEILTWPSAGVLFVDEDGGFTFTGPDGLYVGDQRVWKNGVDQGASTYTLLIGAITGTAGWTEANDTTAIAGSLQGFVTATGNWNEQNDTASLAGTVFSQIAGAATWTEANDAAAVAGTVVNPVSGAAAWAEANDSASILAAVDVQYARAPRGNGYTSQSFTDTTRPAAIQRNKR